MTTQQQALIMETLASIRKTLKRKVYDSDSDSPVEHNTNRGNKLKKRARFVRQGHLETSGGPAAYKEIVEHAGYQRAIVSHNPPLVDDEGYDLDSDDDDEHVQEVEAAAAEENPYAGIQLEQIFAPLASITELPTHPILSRPFTSTSLDELANQACSLTHKENRVLRKVKPLQTKLHGDCTWVPCGVMVGANDEDLFADTERFLQLAVNGTAKSGASLPITNGESRTEPASENASNTASQPDEAAKKGPGDSSRDVRMQDADLEKADAKRDLAGGKKSTNGEKLKTETGQEAKGKDSDQAAGKNENGTIAPKMNGASTGRTDELQANGKGKQAAVGTDGDVEMVEASESQESGSRQAANPELNGSTVPGGGAEKADDLFIHPLFLTPQSAKPDRDLGLPEQESEDIRRLLQLYVQKQEEICRGTKKLYDGLLKADRYRKTVLKWAKAEAHCGPNRDMSDGEDWYDKEEWGLTADLKKGQDEEEEDTVQTQKKTRTRR